MTEEGKYIYCIIGETKGDNPPTTLPSEARTLSNFGYIGINSREVKLVPYKDISVVVSNTPVINFDRLDKKELTKHVAIHQKVNEEVMKDYDVVPMAFGIIAPSIAEVSRILEKAYLQFQTALKKVEGKVEFAVQIWWEPKKILEEFKETDSEIQKLAGKRNVLAKLKLGKLIQKKMLNLRENFLQDVESTLMNISFDSTLNKLIDDEMIANFSFLIEKARESELDKKMQELGKKYEGKLRFKYIGPMPPYSFVNINLNLSNFELIDGARKLLELPQLVSIDEIKKAYYALAHQYHPDKHQGSPETEKQMKRIIEAYNILVNYCVSCYKSMGGAEGSKYSFKKEDVENSILIR